MTSETLDTVDRGILYLLQENARGNTTKEIGEQLDLAASTIGTRINRLEDRGIIEGYNPVINYERAGFDHHYVVICSVPYDECDRYIEEAVDTVDGIVHVRKFFTAKQNLSVEIIGSNRRTFENSVRDLKELDVDVERFEIMDRDVWKPFSQFGKQAING